MLDSDHFISAKKGSKLFRTHFLKKMDDFLISCSFLVTPFSYSIFKY